MTYFLRLYVNEFLLVLFLKGFSTYGRTYEEGALHNGHD